MTARQKQKPYNIHFVCRGNTYRSRLTAAYLHTLTDDRFAISSSGIAADHSTVKTCEPYALATAEKHGLTYGMQASKTQTTTELLQAADVVVFMNKDVYDEACKMYEFDTRKAVVWRVADIRDAKKAEVLAEHSDAALIAAAAGTYRAIKKHCDDLYGYLTKTAWVDVVDQYNQTTHLRLPIAWATDRGLWHRGVHVIVQTSDGKFVVGKRTSTIVFAPGMLQVSLGGGVDSGEEPLHAARRETHEELGVLLDIQAFKPLFMHRHTSYHPHYNKRTRVHVYVYAAKLPVHSKALRPQPGEVDELRVLTKTQVKHLLRTHRLKNFGRLEWCYKFYNKALAYSTLPI
jgi:protein-tyrosine-phosphatase/8-oxo-dGTP pyrophosphatase MutT (NUDIX family)